MRICVAEQHGTRVIGYDGASLHLIDTRSYCDNHLVIPSANVNCVAGGFPIDQILVATYGKCLTAYRWSSGTILWSNKCIPKVRRLCFAAARELYFVVREESPGTDLISMSGELIGHNEFDVIAVNATAELLFVRYRSDKHKLAIVDARGDILWSRDECPEEVLSVAWSSNACAYSTSSGVVEFVCLSPRTEGVRYTRGLWYNVNGFLYSSHRDMFLGVAYDWEKLPRAAVLAFNALRKHWDVLKVLHGVNLGLSLFEDGKTAIKFDNGFSGKYTLYEL
jgi:hypothetical protein